MKRFNAKYAVLGAMVGLLSSEMAYGLTVGIDAVHGYSAATTLGTGSDFSTFRSIIAGMGATLVPCNSFGASTLAGLDVLILNTPYSQNAANYSASDIAAIRAFATRGVFTSDTSMFANVGAGSDRDISFGDNALLVRNAMNYLSAGGGLFVLGDNGTGFDVANLNALVSSFGITYAGTPTAGSGYTVTSFADHPVTAGLRSVGVDYELPITALVPSVDLTTYGGNDNILAAFGPTSGVPDMGGSLSLLGVALMGLECLRRRIR